MLTLSSARVEMGARTLLKETSLLIKQGEKVALVGANGMGKTTLLRSIAGDHTLSAGTVSVPPRTAYLRQETPRLDAADEQTALEYLLQTSPLTALRHEMERLSGLMSTSIGDDLDRAIDEYSELHERFVHAGGYELDATAEQIAKGVGLDDDALLTHVGALSGGQRRKLDLAGLLLAGGDLFILDEPTNHLDVSAKKWVMNFLGQTEATHGLCSSIPADRRVHYVQKGVGHYGVFNGSRFKSEIVPRISDFMVSSASAKPALTAAAE